MKMHALVRHLVGPMLLALLLIPQPLRAEDGPDPAEMARWIHEMKASPRGPFERIRWFCKDGTVLPPGPYACAKHGGGIQHGELNERARILQAAGYPVGTVLAALDPVEIVSPASRTRLKGILLERWLVAADDGWVLRQARHYRGAFQGEDELAAARAMLVELARHGARDRDLLLLRQAALLLPRPAERDTLPRIHDLSTSLAELDPTFQPLRNKIHALPDAGDAERVRTHARAGQRTEPEFEALAQAIDTLFGPRDLTGTLRQVAAGLGRQPLAARLRQWAERWPRTMDAEGRLAASAALLVELREGLASLGPRQRVAVLDLGIDVENEAFTASLELLRGQPQSAPARRLTWLGQLGDVLYGTGLLT
ncbi:MAG: phosphoenolpyruvate synthase, partial [Pseudomonadota bacterium]